MKSMPRVTPYSESFRFLGCFDLDFLEAWEVEVVSEEEESFVFFEGGGGEAGALRFLEVGEGSVGMESPSCSWVAGSRCVARTRRH